MTHQNVVKLVRSGATAATSSAAAQQQGTQNAHPAREAAKGDDMPYVVALFSNAYFLMGTVFGFLACAIVFSL